VTLTSSLELKPHHRLSGRRGFSLIELLTVITVMGIMMTIALPYMRVSPQTKVRAAGRDLVRYLEVIRTRALSTKKSVRLTFDLVDGSYTAYLDDDGDGTFDQTVAESRAVSIGSRRLRTGTVFGMGSASELPSYPGTGPITFDNDRVEFNTRGVTIPFGVRGVVYIRHIDELDAVAAVSISGSASFKVWDYVDGAWQ
jgi:prepilin-type N-terminal cleavage/methylation domain-containing protein